MQNETKLSSEMINSLFRMMKNSKGNQQNIKNIISENLDDTQKKTLSEIMSDPQKIKEILSSPQAKELLNKFSDMKNGGGNNGSA